MLGNRVLGLLGGGRVPVATSTRWGWGTDHSSEKWGPHGSWAKPWSSAGGCPDGGWGPRDRQVKPGVHLKAGVLGPLQGCRGHWAKNGG